ncbi:PAS domain-containing protein [Flavisolibacter nicotianae]|uniref:PAS domain-containing protein n=1 Tax=Flavisolibacter nicotianae TaxID=2364882 RepID=UPI000EB49702|nr:PAS domain-containing protein [Flavisolibacter nicotianae]
MKQLEQQVFDLMMQAAVPFSINKGENHIVEFANDTALQIVGKTIEIIGKPIFEIIPEVEAQGYIQLLDTVRQTGQTYQAFESPFTLIVNGQAPALR